MVVLVGVKLQFLERIAGAVLAGPRCALVSLLVVVGTLTATAESVEHIVEPEELKFSKPWIEERGTVTGDSLLMVIGLRKVPEGQTGVLFGCYPGGRVAVAFRLHPSGRLNFAWSKDNSKGKDKFALPIEVEYKIRGQPVKPWQKYSAIVEVEQVLDVFKKSIEVPYLPIPPTQEFIRSDWEYVRLAAKVNAGDKVSVLIKRSDPELAAFFDQCRAGS